MMAAEGPFLAAIIARLPDPKFNLAAYGVAIAFAILVEAPVIMIMSASTALVEDGHTFRKLRNFTFALNALITGIMLLVLVPSIFGLIMQDLIGLPDEVARLTYGALWILLPWPAVIGYRRFFQGLLIRAGRTRLVAYGTAIRLSVMATTCLFLYLVLSVPGAYVGAAALTAGVCVEAVASRLMARGTVRDFVARPHVPSSAARALGYRRIADFYFPLALTSVIGLAVHPMLTFFMGRARFPLESLAVFPVVNSLSFVFRSLGVSYQEAVIALLGKKNEHVKELGRFGIGLGLTAAGVLTLLAFTPLAYVWFELISGLTRDLSVFAILPTKILAPLPALSVLLSYQRGILVQGHLTRPITTASVLEVLVIALGFVLLSQNFAMAGVTAAVIAFLAGRLVANLYLVRPCVDVLSAGAEPADTTVGDSVT